MAMPVLKTQFTAQIMTLFSFQGCRKEGCRKAPGESPHPLPKRQVCCTPARVFTARKGEPHGGQKAGGNIRMTELTQKATVALRRGETVFAKHSGYTELRLRE